MVEKNLKMKADGQNGTDKMRYVMEELGRKGKKVGTDTLSSSEISGEIIERLCG